MKIANDHTNPENEKILVHTFGENHNLEDIKKHVNGIAVDIKHINGITDGVKNVHQDNESGGPDHIATSTHHEMSHARVNTQGPHKDKPEQLSPTQAQKFHSVLENMNQLKHKWEGTTPTTEATKGDSAHGKETSSGHLSVTNSQSAKESLSKSKLFSKQVMQSSRKPKIVHAKAAGRSKSTAAAVRKGTPKFGNSLVAAARKQSSKGTGQKSKTVRVNTPASFSKKAASRSGRLLRPTPKQSSKVVATTKIKHIVGAGTKQPKKASFKAGSYSKSTGSSKLKTQMPRKAQSQQKLTIKTPSQRNTKRKGGK